MGFLDRAIRKGISDAVGKAVGDAVKTAVTPMAEKYVNRTAQQLDNAASQLDSAGAARQNQEQSGVRTAGLEGALANFQRSVESFATQMGQNIKLCPGCGEGVPADKKFCPHCGAKLPEQTVADGAVCSSCGMQNTIGTKFCQGCGAKLPFAVAEDQAAAAADEEILARWESELPQYPRWNCGGHDFRLENYDGARCFIAFFDSPAAARQAVERYRGLAQANGFIMAGRYKEIEHLYKYIGGVWYHIDTEHLFEAGDDNPNIYFYVKEPSV